MIRSLLLLTLFLVGSVQVACSADAELPLCPRWAKSGASDPLLRQAFEAAYPPVTTDADGEEPSPLSCLFPYKVLTFETSVVLITLAGEPGEACHGCPAKVSAVFLRRDGNALIPFGRHDAFTEAGTFGDLVGIAPIRLGTEEGLVIEGGGTFQGYSFRALNLYLIRNGRLKPVGPADGISSGDTDCGVRGEPCRSVDGYWRVEGRRFIVRYIGEREDATKVDGDVVYELRKGSLVRISGHKLAKEMKENRP